MRTLTVEKQERGSEGAEGLLARLMLFRASGQLSGAQSSEGEAGNCSVSSAGGSQRKRKAVVCRHAERRE